MPVGSAATLVQQTEGYEKRTSGLWVHTGQFIVRGGSVDLPNGSIGTSEIAPNAVQQLLGSYATVPTWSTAVASSWVLTPIQVLFTSGGGLLRCEWSLTASHSAPNGNWMIAFGWDGTAQIASAVAQGSTGSLPVTCSGLYYFNIPASTHTAQLFVYLLSAGTLTLNPNVYQTLYVTEQKR